MIIKYKLKIYPSIIMYNMTPNAHISKLGFAVTFFINTSGAMYFKLPALVGSKFKIPAIPKSTTFTVLHSLDFNKMFSNFKSRCIRYCLWQ
jgi:hypothetical protein